MTRPRPSDPIARIERWLSAHRPGYLARLRPGASDAALDALTARFGLPPLPTAFRALWRWRDGQPDDCFEGFVDNRSVMPLGEMAASKALLDSMIGLDFEDPRWWRRGWLPFTHNGGGDHLCLDLAAEDGGAPGQVVAFWHDWEDRAIVAPSFDAWLAGVADDLEAGRAAVDGA